MTYSAWLELEIGLDSHAIALTWKERRKLFAQRIEECLSAIEHSAPGVREKLEIHPARPFACTGQLTADEIRAIWFLPELRMLHDSGAKDLPVPDATGRLPYLVEVLQHIQAEEISVVEIERLEVIVRALDAEDALRVAAAECGNMPAYFMGGDYRIHRRWWTAERAFVNSLYDEQRLRHGDAIVVDQTNQPNLKDQPKWRPDASVERVAYGSPKERPRSWEWMVR